jgi:hypothetical protein
MVPGSVVFQFGVVAAITAIGLLTRLRQDNVNPNLGTTTSPDASHGVDERQAALIVMQAALQAVGAQL